MMCTLLPAELYLGTEVFAFLCFALFILFFLALVIFQNAVSDQLGISEWGGAAPLPCETGLLVVVHLRSAAWPHCQPGTLCMALPS